MKRVAIVTADIMGPITNGGVGSAFYFLACTLAKEFSVSILFIPEQIPAPIEMERWTEFYRARNIELRYVNDPEINLVGAPYSLRSYATYLDLLTCQFDIVHFADFHGLGYYTMLAAQYGGEFPDTVFAVHLHGPTFWHRQSSGGVLQDQREIELHFLERSSVALADLVISPSQYLADWMKSNNWTTRHEILVIPHAPIPIKDLTKQTSQEGPREVLFMGRMEDRKGFAEFIEALKLIKRPLRASIWGKEGIVRNLPANDFIQKNRSDIQAPLEIHQSKNHLQTLEYMAKHRPLVVMPSYVENSPCGVFECLALNLEFICGSEGGTLELLHPDDRLLMLQKISPQQISEKIESRLLSPTPVIPRPNPELLNAQEKWISLHHGLQIYRPPFGNYSIQNSSVAVCISTKNRPSFLAQALESLNSQTWNKFSIVVADDGSSDENSKKNQNIINKYSEIFKILYFKTDSRGPSLARNLAVEKADAEFIVFLDDDNIALPQEIEFMIQAQALSEADIITCPLEQFQHSPDGLIRPFQRWIPTGSCLGLAPYRNVFGDTNMLIRKSVFTACEGFSGEVSIGEDWDLLWRAVEKGYQLEVLPKPLVYYRKHPQNRSSEENLIPKINYPEPTRQYLKRIPYGTREIVMMSLNQSASPIVFAPKKSDQASVCKNENSLDLLSDKASQSIVLKNIELQKYLQGFAIKTLTEDPQIIYHLKLENTQLANFAIKIYSATESYIQLYFQNPKKPFFCEDQAMLKTLSAGWNELYFSIQDEEICGFLRLDFADKQTEYFIEYFSLNAPTVKITSNKFSYNFDVFNGQLNSKVVNKINWLMPDQFTTENIELINSSEHSFDICATNNDPILKTKIPVREDSLLTNWIAEIVVPETTRMQFFFDTSANQTFNEDHCVTISLKEGLNIIKLSFYHPWPVSDWRIDPGISAGKYQIKRIGYYNGLL